MPGDGARSLVARSAAVGALVVLALGAAGFVAVGGGRAGGKGSGEAATREQLWGSHDFRLFDAGDRVEGWPLTAIVERDDSARFVSFLYGDCRATDDLGCAPPAEIQVWPSCLRSLAAFDRPRPEAPVPERVHVRSVPAAFFDAGARLELQTGRSTIVLFSDTRERLVRIAGALRSLDGAITVREPLPPPAAPPAARTAAAGKRGVAMEC